MKFRLLLLLLVWTICSFSQEHEIRVHLPTSSSLIPIYLGHLQGDRALDTNYLAQLEALLQSDLNYNGTSQVMPQSQEKETFLIGDPKTWKILGASHVIQWEVAEKNLKVRACTPQTGSIKHFPDIPLTGTLSQDRGCIHQLADALHQALFHENGIAHSRILFSFQMKNPQRDASAWISEIWECDWDGANLKQITHEGSYCVSPVLVPKHASYASDRFLFVSYKGGQPKIYIASTQDPQPKRFIRLPGNQLLPTISPARDQIAFICDAGGRTDLFVQPLNPTTGSAGKPIQLFSYPRSTQASPTFSPDGSKIAFASDKDGGIRIYVIPTTPTPKRANAQMITKQNRENSCPSWSPDGTKLAYSAKTNGIRQLWIYDFHTEEEWQLTSGPGNKENPCWAPDSKHLVFNSTDNDASELYVVNLNQPQAVQITNGPGKKHYPTWGMK